MRPDPLPSAAHDGTDTTPPGAWSSRRAMLAGVVGGAAGWLAAAASRLAGGETRAAAGDPLILGQQNFAGPAATRLFATSSGGAFWMTQNGSGSGVRGESISGSGGVFETHHAARHGLVAQNDAAAGTGTALRAIGGANTGIHATTSNAGRSAVHGLNTATAGLYSDGVIGETNSSNGRGVFGLASSGSGTTTGVWGEASAPGGRGVLGTATAASGGGYGVYGRSDGPTGRGVFGFAGGGTGQSHALYGLNDSSAGTAVYGEAISPTGTTYGVRGRNDSESGYGGYFANVSSNGIGLYATGEGSSRSKAVLQVHNTRTGNTSGAMSAYVTNSSNFATAHLANAGNGEVLYLQNGGSDADGTGGGDFIRAVNNPESDSQFRVLSSGEVRSDVGFNTPAADFAEMLPAEAGLEPGDVLVIGMDGRLARSTLPHQDTLAGVYSTRPGFVGGRPVEGDRPADIPLAIVGIVPVKATAENGPIRPGDLLTSSTVPGHAMRANGEARLGCVIGKALSPLTAGRGRIEMLVMLQ